MGTRPYTTRAQQALTLAETAAATRGDEFVGTEHLLLGLLAERTGPAAQILGHLGVTSERVEQLSRRPARAPSVLPRAAERSVAADVGAADRLACGSAMMRCPRS